MLQQANNITVILKDNLFAARDGESPEPTLTAQPLSSYALVMTPPETSY